MNRMPAATDRRYKKPNGPTTQTGSALTRVGLRASVLIKTMAPYGNIPLAGFRLLERTGASVPGLNDLKGEVQCVLSALGLPLTDLRGRRIALAVGSRGIARLRDLVKAACDWLKAQGAQPFVFPAMGSHGGATAEGQRKILEEYGVTESSIGVEVRSSMETVLLGTTPEGFRVFMDRSAWEADGVVVLNRVKPHTDFSGTIESGLLKMMAVGMGKRDGAQECHRRGWKLGLETAIRVISARVLSTRRILAGLAVIENEIHQVAAVRAARPEGIVAMEEDALKTARQLVARIPFSRFQLLIINELGKNISGTGMDTKVIGRGVELQPGEAPEVSLIYVRDLTPESGGNAIGVGFADVIHERLFQKIDFEKMYLNARIALNPSTARVPIHLPTDGDALNLLLGHLGSPEPSDQRLVWIRNTLNLDRLAVSESLVEEASKLKDWRVMPETYCPEVDPAGNITSPL